MLGWLETACSRYTNRALQIHVIGMCGNRGNGKRSISISGTGALIHTVGISLGLYLNCFVLDKTEGWGPRRTIFKGKPAQRNEAFNFQEANQTREPPQCIITPGWTISPCGPSHSTWVHLSTLPARNRLPRSNNTCLEKSLGIVKVPCSPFNQILLPWWHRGLPETVLGKPAYCKGQLRGPHFWLSSLEPHPYQHLPYCLLPSSTHN